MSVQTEITRIQTARNTLRTKAVELGIAAGTDKLDILADAFDGITNQGLYQRRSRREPLTPSRKAITMAAVRFRAFLAAATIHCSLKLLQKKKNSRI